MTGGDYLIDHVEHLTHLKYDDTRTRCGLWFLMWKREDHDYQHVHDAVPSCLVCAVWDPIPLDKPLWRTFQ